MRKPGGSLRTQGDSKNLVDGAEPEFRGAGWGQPYAGCGTPQAQAVAAVGAAGS